ncbi:MAG: ShlB/FhaC/HecB family hemolysin secretion/activation protein [Symploca sp. SIO2E9]|nr:ShlB/FhaC/HecB family hemolysin secretion/activation protein [Symploca sp. SIO2E9]
MIQSIPVEWSNQSKSLVSNLDIVSTSSLVAQTLNITQNSNSPPVPVQPQDVLPNESSPSPDFQTPTQPSPIQEEQLQQTPSSETTTPAEEPEIFPGSILVEKFEFIENKITVFSEQELSEAIKICISKKSPKKESPEEAQACPSEKSSEEIDELFTKQPLLLVKNKTFSFTQLVEITSEIAKFYAKHGYRTSGATIVLPENTPIGEPGVRAVIKINVIEGKLEDLKVIPCETPQSNSDSLNHCTVTDSRLNRSYVRSRLGVEKSEVLNVDKLQEALQLLQLDPLIERVSATISEGSSSDQSILQVRYREADSFRSQLGTNNGRSPSVGTFQRRVALTEVNLLGIGDRLSVGYSNTDGSNGWNASYTLPLNPRDGTLSFTYSRSNNDVIEPPFNDIDGDGSRPDIESASRTYELTLRQPIIRDIKSQKSARRSTFQELALGLTASLRESETSLLDIPFPLSPGADDEGFTRVFALRFFQQWTQQNEREVLALRSQFNFGFDAFDSTINEPIAETNEVVPDSRFFSWQGQAQWLRVIADDTLLLVRANAQLADQALVSSEQFALGGLGSVRGYRQDTLQTDNGIFTSAEVQLPVLGVFKDKGVIQMVPFVDFGTAWNSSGNDNPDPNTLASVGLGLQWRQGNNFTARLDWGIPLISVDSRDRTWQENGLHFSVQWNPF